ncbi:flagellar protein FlgN [Bacillus sp. RO2]|jgi:flagellar biosynthesis/type III secretory pathway chaperone|uniref:flagellar protein FlgN n=1 Tax=Bacillus sp. RO2 TaxID=2723913 RepID=UPI00145F9991|nr:flagellar protein FlgN [Bacillus sp. RO2]NMH75202.1 flagellar protein FlgN [Bacillus sp. RO2]
MSIPTIITILEKMHTLHAYLYELTVRKEEIVKVNKVEELQQITREEKQYTRAIVQLEKQRAELSEGKTVTELAEVSTPTEKQALLDLKAGLTETIGNIQKQNELNQLLLEQSLQFVTMTLNTLNPQPNAVNYEKPANTKKSVSAPARSLFDSRA